MPSTSTHVGIPYFLRSHQLYHHRCAQEMSNHKRRYGQLEGTEYVYTLYPPCLADLEIGWMTCPLFL